MIRCAFVAPERPRCGISDYSRQLFESLRALSPPVLELEWHALPGASDRDRSAGWRRLAHSIRGASVVHVQYEQGLFGRIGLLEDRFSDLLLAASSPVVVTRHGPRPASKKERLRRLLLRAGRVRPCGDVVVVHTRRLADETLRELPEHRVVLTPLPLPEVTRRWSGIERTHGLVSPGFLKRHKNFEAAVPVLEELAAERPDLRWTLFGGVQDDGVLGGRDREYERELEARIRASLARDRIRRTGFLESARAEREMCAHRLAFFPYRTMTASAAMAWAMALGLPVVATDLEPVRELARAGAGIETVPLEQPLDWPRLIGALYDDPARLRDLSERNRDFASRHDFPALAVETTELYQQCVRLAGRGSGPEAS